MATSTCERFCTIDHCSYCSGTGKIANNPRAGVVGGQCRHCKGNGECEAARLRAEEEKKIKEARSLDSRWWGGD